MHLWRPLALDLAGVRPSRALFLGEEHLVDFFFVGLVVLLLSIRQPGRVAGLFLLALIILLLESCESQKTILTMLEFVDFIQKHLHDLISHDIHLLLLRFGLFFNIWRLFNLLYHFFLLLEVENAVQVHLHLLELGIQAL